MGKRHAYMVVTETRPDKLSLIVETLLEQGYKLAGGVSVFGFPGGREYFQAMHYERAASPAVEGGGTP